MIKVRFAPSPTGYLHIGGARTAIFNWLFARQQSGQFLLRIEDTDRERSGQEMIGAIFQGLQWLGLDWDGEPVLQSQRLDIYRDYANRLVREGRAFRCFCPPEKIMRQREQAIQQKITFRYDGTCRNLSPDEVQQRLDAGEAFTIRFRLPEGPVQFQDLLHGAITVEHEVLDDFIVLRSDGTPTYHLAVVVDDYEMGITHVIRGDDHLSNTPKQVLLYEAFGWQMPQFLHVPLIHGPDRRRLSKRHGATSVQEYRDRGYLPEAMFNYLTLLGWSPGTDEEIFTREELIDRFSLDGLSRSSAIFDEQKLLWMNAQHLYRLSGEELFDRVAPLLEEAGLATMDELQQRHDYVEKILELLKPRAKLLTDFAEQMHYFFYEPETYDEKGVKKHWKGLETAERLEALRSRLAGLESWTEAEIEAVVRGLAEEMQISAAKLIHPTRLAISGRTATPGLFEVMALLGPDVVLRRMKKAVEIIKNYL
ncbi:MAG: glutamate--tRNA ligase [candidate division KSB1 bacterium]|nr:glutamate--tRNA ligase [candidate division KSB1 bacterium]